MSYECLSCKGNPLRNNPIYPKSIIYSTVQQAHDHNKLVHNGKAKFKPIVKPIVKDKD